MPAKQPHIRSFVLRQGRVSNAQQRAHDTLLPKYGIPYEARVLDLDAVFGRSAPRVLEIGFGMGETTAAIAAVATGRSPAAIGRLAFAGCSRSVSRSRMSFRR